MLSRRTQRNGFRLYFFDIAIQANLVNPKSQFPEMTLFLGIDASLTHVFGQSIKISQEEIFLKSKGSLFSVQASTVPQKPFSLLYLRIPMRCAPAIFDNQSLHHDIQEVFKRISYWLLRGFDPAEGQNLKSCLKKMKLPGVGALLFFILSRRSFLWQI